MRLLLFLVAGLHQMLALLLVQNTNAYIGVEKPCRQWRFQTDKASSLHEAPGSTEMMHYDIEEMRRQAQNRFNRLSSQIKELKEIKNKKNQYERKTTGINLKKVAVYSNTVGSCNSLDNLDGETSTQQQELQEPEVHLIRRAMNGIHGKLEDSTEVTSSQQGTQTFHPTQVESYSTDLLDNTRWKIVFSIGRESGTWMPPTWGLSGDRVLFQVVVDFSSEPLYDQDEFFQGTAGTKRLDVVESFLIPRGVGSLSVGRRPVSCKPNGGYKVCRGQGPIGTDLLRLYIELTEDVFIQDHKSDVFCPHGRIYATCGYFVVHDSNTRTMHKAAKETAQEAHRNALLHHELIQHQIDTNGGIFSIEKLRLMKELYSAKHQVEETAKQIQIARQREPDKAHIRLSKKGDVGLSKDGGVCCKVQKGMALEYHILGRMETGCVDVQKNLSSCEGAMINKEEQ